MRSYYNVIDSLKTVITEQEQNNNVSQGDIGDIDLSKQTIFPLAHIVVNSASIEENHVSFNITIYYLDLVDFSKKDNASLFLGNDNEQDVYNTQLALATRVLRVLQKANLYKDSFEILNASACTPLPKFSDNNLTGWESTFDIAAKDNMTYCSV
jgi:hypothetical protein|tara:strand:+ start:243 stop:704 length:462 start_codon:yes stop_codon:yes gene_type:complete